MKHLNVKNGEEKTILFCLSGQGHFDLSAYEAYNAGKLEYVDDTEDILVKGFTSIPEKE